MMFAPANVRTHNAWLYSYSNRTCRIC